MPTDGEALKRKCTETCIYARFRRSTQKRTEIDLLARHRTGEALETKMDDKKMKVRVVNFLTAWRWYSEKLWCNRLICGAGHVTRKNCWYIV